MVYCRLCLLLSESSITDWIQAVAALGAVVFGIFTVIDLLKRGKEIEKNIDILTKTQEQHVIIAQEASAQTYLMREYNEAIAKLIESLTESVQR